MERPQRTTGLRAAVGVDPRMSLALWLRQGRATRGMSVDDVAKVTKIQVRILESLEAGRFDALPADVFVRGFVRSFARCVGLDEQEALKRYLACGRVVETVPPAARAFVETMGDLAPQTAGRQPAMLDTKIEVVDAQIEVEIGEPIVEPAPRTAIGTDETPTVAAAVEPVPVTALLPPTGTLVDEGEPKKKRTRKAKATGAPSATRKRRRKKGDDGIDAGDSLGQIEPMTDAEAAALVDGETETSADSGAMESADSGAKSKRRRKAKRELVAAVDTEAKPAADVETDAGARDAGDDRTSAASDMWSAETAEAVADAMTASTSTPAEIVAEPIPTTDATPVEAASDSTGTWTPKMPAPTSTPPWRRTFPTTTAPSAPSLTIDDADPDSAERILEDRAAERTQARRSFLPPILLDRDDRSARQGGLTLAVIILLIAATLTLSYLMRRPSSSGDGMTMAETPATLVG